MPVKSIASPLLLSILILGCASPRRTERLDYRSIVLAQSRAGRFTSLFDTGNSLTAVFSNWESASLTVTDIPDSAWQDSTTENPRNFRTDFSDKIDVAPIQAPDFGEHIGAMIGFSLHVLYPDRRMERRPILKWLSRSALGDWRVDVLEPAGQPIACIANGIGNPVAFWSTDSLLAGGKADSSPRIVLSPFSPAAAGCAVGEGFTVYDLTTRRLLFISAREEEIEVRDIPGGNPLHYSILTARGTLAVVTFNPSTGRILLLEQADKNDGWRRTTVAFSEDTRSLFFTPYDSGYLFLYDSLERKSAGAPAHALSLLVPHGRRYDRYTLWAAKKPISGFSAVIRANTLFVLASREKTELLRIEIPDVAGIGRL